MQHSLNLAHWQGRWFFLSMLLCFGLTMPHTSASIITDESEEAYLIDREISGTVTDEEGNPLVGATIRVKNTTIGIITDEKGFFRLTVPDAATTIVVTYVGFDAQEILINNRSEINVEMGTTSLDQVIITGYGTQGRAQVSAAVSQVDAEELEVDKRPVTRLESALVGSVPGLILNFDSGRPGDDTDIQVRAVSALSSRGALVLIDGFEGSINDVNPNDIASVSILKDAAATAIYGARSANGVILITTKDPRRNEKVSLTYNGYYSWQEPAEIAELTNSLEFMEFSNEAAINEALRNDPDLQPGDVAVPFSEADVNRARSGFYPDTKWVEEAYSENAGQFAHNLSITGGGENIGYLINLGYLKQEGLSVGADNFERFSLRLKLDADITDWLSAGVNAFNTLRNTDNVPITEGSNLRGRPFFPVRNEEGIFVDKGAAGGEPNPVARAASGSYDISNRDALNLQLYAQVRPVTNLVIEGRLSYVNSNTFREIWNTPYEFVILDLELNQSGPVIPTDPANRSLQFRSIRNYTINTLTTARYELSLNQQHNFSFLAGWQTQEGEGVDFRAERFNFILPNLQSLSLGQEIAELGNSSERGDNRTTLSGFGRIAYNFSGKYLAEFNFRADASSNFGPNNQWGYFPAVSVGWNADQEPFIDDLGFVDVLKLRASWGLNGDDGSINAVERANFSPIGVGFGGVTVPILSLGDAINPDLKWETSEKINVGLDAVFWKGLFGLTAEYFIDQRSDIITILQTSEEGGLGGVLDNVYDAEAWGWEFTLTHRNKLGPVGYFANANLSYYNSEITNTDGVSPLSTSVTNFQDQGLPILGNLFGYETDGYFDNQAEIDAHVDGDGNPIDQSSLVTQGDEFGRYLGGYKYIDQLTVDTNGDGIPDARDGVINTDDRIVLKENTGDNFRVGANLGVSYAGFSLSARFYGVLEGYEWWRGGDFLNPFTGDRAPFAFQTDTWTPDNPNARFPSATASNILPFTDEVSDLIADRSYIKVKNINLNYTFDQSLLSKLDIIKALDIYVSVENLGVLWTNYDLHDEGFDPEFGAAGFRYPLPITTTVGVNVKF